MGFLFSVLYPAASAASAASRRQPPTTCHHITQLVITTCHHTTCSLTTCPHITCPHTQLALTQLAHTQLNSHTTCSHITHTTCHHTTCSHTHNSTHTQLAHTHLVLPDIHLRDRRGTWRHPPSFHVAGVALGHIHIRFTWQAWHLRHWAGSGGAPGSQLTPWTPRLFAWQAWHLAKSTHLTHNLSPHTTYSSTHNLLHHNPYHLFSLCCFPHAIFTFLLLLVGRSWHVSLSGPLILGVPFNPCSSQSSWVSGLTLLICVLPFGG